MFLYVRIILILTVNRENEYILLSVTSDHLEKMIIPFCFIEGWILMQS